MPTQYGQLVLDGVLPWKPAPGSVNTGVSKEGEFEFRYEHNREGFRDVDRPHAKPPGVFRIVAVGDSFTYGIGAKMEETYLAQLERMLNERQGHHPRVEIVKLGIWRYWPEPERLVLEHFGVAYEPDLVLVGFVLNDFSDTIQGLEGYEVSRGFLVRGHANRLGGWVPWLSENSHAVRALLAALLVPASDEVESGAHITEVWEEMFGEYLRMVKLARGAGARLVIANVPNRETSDQWARQPAKRLGAFCRNAGCRFIDALPAVLAHEDPASLFWPHDGHCTPAGYRVVAEAIFAGLERSGWVP